MKIQVLLAACMLAGLAGCSQEAPPAADTGAATTPAPAAEAAAQGQPPAGEATFTMDPASFQVCEGKPRAIASTAKWNVAARNIAEVSIYVTNPRKDVRKLWLNGGATGESTTGTWVFPDSKFELVERGSEKPVAEFTVKALPCD